MKKILVSILFLLVGVIGFSQTNKTAYVDFEYILKKSPEYTEATLELEKRAKDWQSEISKKKAEITKMKDALSVERALLTTQLIDEKQEEIQLLESELNTYQHEKFGIEGDYFKQKENIYKPLLDQIHTISNDIAVKKRLDIVLIKGNDNTMVYANKRNDITELVLKEMDRSRTRGKMSKKEIAALEAQDKADEIKERQRTKRELLQERQNELEDPNFNTSTTSETNSVAQPTNTETEVERRKRQNEERIAEAKKKQEEIREAQLKKIEIQKEAIKKKQEEIRLVREKAVQDALDRKNNATKSTNSSQSNSQNLSEKQKEMLALREQKQKEAKAKQEKVLAERKAAAELRKKEAEALKNQRLKEIEELKQKRLKELEEKKNSNK